MPRTSKPFLVGLCGPDGVGKSTSASNAARTLTEGGVMAVTMSFAGPLYACVSAMLGVSIAELKSRKLEVLTKKTAPIPCLAGKTFRWLLRTVGTEAMRQNVDQQVWVQLAQRHARLSGAQVVIFDDCRFDNEAKVCDYVIELRRKGVSYSKAHASDVGVSDALIGLHANIKVSPEKFGVEIAARVVWEREIQLRDRRERRQDRANEKAGVVTLCRKPKADKQGKGIFAVLERVRGGAKRTDPPAKNLRRARAVADRLMKPERPTKAALIARRNLAAR